MKRLDDVLDEGFEAFAQRLLEHRLTPAEFIQKHAGITYSTYWRARDRHVGPSARTRTLKHLEIRLDCLEASDFSADALEKEAFKEKTEDA